MPRKIMQNTALNKFHENRNVKGNKDPKVPFNVKSRETNLLSRRFMHRKQIRRIICGQSQATRTTTGAESTRSPAGRYSRRGPVAHPVMLCFLAVLLLYSKTVSNAHALPQDREHRVLRIKGENGTLERTIYLPRVFQDDDDRYVLISDSSQNKYKITESKRKIKRRRKKKPVNHQINNNITDYKDPKCEFCPNISMFLCVRKFVST